MRISRNQIGIELAKGKIKNINTDQQIESWLAMYTIIQSKVYILMIGP